MRVLQVPGTQPSLAACLQGAPPCPGDTVAPCPVQVRRRRAASRGPSALRSAPASTPWSAAATSTSRPCPGASPRTSRSCECRAEGLPSSSATLLQGVWGRGAPLSCLGARGPCQVLPQHGAEPSAASRLVCKGCCHSAGSPAACPVHGLCTCICMAPPPTPAPSRTPLLSPHPPLSHLPCEWLRPPTLAAGVQRQHMSACTHTLPGSCPRGPPCGAHGCANVCASRLPGGRGGPEIPVGAGREVMLGCSCSPKPVGGSVQKWEGRGCSSATPRCCPPPCSYLDGNQFTQVPGQLSTFKYLQLV